MILFDFQRAEKTGGEDLQLIVTRNYFSSLLFFILATEPKKFDYSHSTNLKVFLGSHIPNEEIRNLFKTLSDKFWYLTNLRSRVILALRSKSL